MGQTGVSILRGGPGPLRRSGRPQPLLPICELEPVYDVQAPVREMKRRIERLH